MLPIPFGNKVIYKDAPDVWILVIASLLYICGYYFFALKKFTKEDLLEAKAELFFIPVFT